jgi:hypothetical protein
MSEPIPESIPTSQDPRSKRPLKKRALSPRSQRASEVTALFAKPDQTIVIPRSATSSSTALTNASHAVPEIVQNVQGSSAGAGSGEFHVYKASRRREYERLRGMEEEVRNEEEGERWEREKREREERDAEVTRKKREKREKAKGRGKGAGKGKDGTAGVKVAKARIELKPRTEDGEEPENNEKVGDAKQEAGIVIHDDD